MALCEPRNLSDPTIRYLYRFVTPAPKNAFLRVSPILPIGCSHCQMLVDSTTQQAYDIEKSCFDEA